MVINDDWHIIGKSFQISLSGRVVFIATSKNMYKVFFVYIILLSNILLRIFIYFNLNFYRIV